MPNKVSAPPQQATPKEEITTRTLLKRLLQTKNVRRFIKRYQNHMVPISLKNYLCQLCMERNTVPARIIEKSGIDHTYGHQLFNGRRNRPSRDKVIQLTFGFSMSLDEAQTLLRIARKSPLYTDITRDVVIIHALGNRLSVDDVQATLYDMELPLLGEDGD